MNTEVFIAVALAIPSGFGAIALVIRIADWVADQVNDYHRSKQIQIIPDGKGGYIQLPPGCEYIQTNSSQKEETT